MDEATKYAAGDTTTQPQVLMVQVLRLLGATDGAREPPHRLQILSSCLPGFLFLTPHPRSHPVTRSFGSTTRSEEKIACEEKHLSFIGTEWTGAKYNGGMENLESCLVLFLNMAHRYCKLCHMET